MAMWRAAAGSAALAGLVAVLSMPSKRSAEAPAAPAGSLPSPVVYDAAVVGGGVVGLAVLRELAVRGYRVALIEKEAHLVAGAASSGNSGTRQITATATSGYIFWHPPKHTQIESV